MPRHDDPLVSFDVPRDWDNKTIIAYAAPVGPGGGATANLVMTRDRLRPDEDLLAYADRHVDELAKRLSGFSLIDSHDAEVAGRPAIHVSFQSDADDGALRQRLTMVLLPDRLVAAFTFTAPERDVDQLEPLFERILSSVRFATSMAAVNGAAS